ncbi:MAG: Uma2 family endonuclease [Treponema sp.]|jgi:Uma2 family endonuclease|nr:Uma2 family endonuclease [Treponema sp.]
MAIALEKDLGKKSFTYADCLEWDEDLRAEIIDGSLYVKSPPATDHQRVGLELSYQIKGFLRGKTPEVFIAPFGVRLFPKKDLSDGTLVEPDIVVVCDPAQIDKRGCNGAPDLIIEILSPSNSRHDRFTKFDLYLRAKVREYWVVDPDEKEVQTYILAGDHYIAKAYGYNEPTIKPEDTVPDIVPVTVLPGLEIDLKTVFSTYS